MSLLLTGGSGAFTNDIVISGDFSIVFVIELVNAGTEQTFFPSAGAFSDRLIYQGNRATPRIRYILDGGTLNRDLAGIAEGDTLTCTLSRTGGGNVVFAVTTQSTDYGSVGFTRTNPITFSTLSGTSNFLSLDIDNGGAVNEYDFNAAPAATSIPDLVGSNDITLSGSYTVDDDGGVSTPAINNTNYQNFADTASSLAPSDFSSIALTRADFESETLSIPSFNERARLAALAQAYNVTGDTAYLNACIAMIDNYLNMRDDIYTAGGGNVFINGQDFYRSAPNPYLGTTNAAPAWSAPFTEAEGTGRRLEILRTARIVSAFAFVVLGIKHHNPSGSYVVPTGATSDNLSGTYSSIADTIIIRMHEANEAFDQLWQQDLVNADVNDNSGNLWDVSGWYFYDKRYGLSPTDGIDIDSPLPQNHLAGLIVSKLVVARYSDLDTNAVDRHNRCNEFFSSIFTGTNPDLTATIFGLQANDGYSWPYVFDSLLYEDIDHVVITLEWYITAYRMGLVDRTTVERLVRAVESVYDGGNNVYDRLYTVGDRYTAHSLLSGTANWISTNTTLQDDFALLANTQEPTGIVNVRNAEAILAFHGSEQLSELNYTDTTLTAIPTDLANTESFYEWVQVNLGVTLTTGAVFHVSAEGVTLDGESQVNIGPNFTSGFFAYTPSGGQRSETYQFGAQDFAVSNTAQKFSGEKVFTSKALLDAMGNVTYSGLPQHDGASGAVLTDADRNFIEADLIGGTVYNQRDGSSGVITAATVNSITAPLSGGTNNTWNLGDEYLIFHPENGIFGSESTQIQITNLANLPTSLSEMHFRLYASHEAFSADQSNYPNELIQSTSSQASRNVADGRMVYFESSDLSDRRLLTIRPNSNTTYFTTAITDSAVVSGGSLLNSNAIDSDLTTSTGADIVQICTSFTQTETYTHVNRVRQPALSLVTTGAWDETLCDTIRLGQTGGNGIGDFWIQGFELYDGVYEPELEEFTSTQGTLSIGVLPDSFMLKNIPDVQPIDNQATISAEITRQAAKNGYDVSYVNAAKNGFGWANASNRINSTDIDLIAAGNCSLALIWPTVNDLSETGWTAGINSIQDYTDALFPTLELLAQVPSIDNIIVCTQVPFLNSASSAGFGGTNALSEFHYNDTQYIDAVNNVWLNLATDTRLSALFRSKCLPTIDLDQALTYSREHTIGSATAVPTAQNGDFHPSQLGNLALSSVLTPAVLEASGVIEPSLPPVIAPSQTFTANENQAIGSSIGTLSVTPNGTIEAVNTNNPNFVVDPSTLNITFNQVVTNVGTVIVAATPVNENGDGETVTFTIDIADVDETVTPTAQDFSLTMAVDDARNIAGGVLGQLVFTNLSTGESILFTGTDGSMFSNTGAALEAIAPFSEGSFSAIYTVPNVDPDGVATQIATGTITLTVTAAADVTPPVITLLGNNPDTVQINTTYNDPGATFVDDSGESGAANTNDTIDTSVLGSQTITYTATDSSNNSSTLQRVVNIVQGTPGGEIPDDGTNGPSVIYSSVNLPSEENDYFYAEVDGETPDGLSFNDDGSFTWTGLTAGTHQFSVTIYKNGSFLTSGVVRVVVE